MDKALPFIRWGRGKQREEPWGEESYRFGGEGGDGEGTFGA